MLRASVTTLAHLKNYPRVVGMNAMNHPAGLDEEEPLDPATERVRKKMVRLLIVSIGIMVIGLMAVFGAIVYKIGNRTSSQKPATAATMSPIPVPESANYIGKIDLPDNATIVSTSLSGSQILLQIKLADGSLKLWLYDVPTGRQFGAIDIE